MTDVMLNVKFDKDIDINLNLKPNEILKKM